MTEPLISVIVITYNSAKYILETLESVKNQTYTKLELIISDDCSSDKTVEICNKWIKENNDRFVRTKLICAEHNTGIAANLNRGIKEAKGEWIKGFAGDDLLLPNALQVYMDEIKKDVHNEKLVYHAKIEVLYDNIEETDKFDLYGDPKFQRFNQEDTTAEEQFNILLRFCPVAAVTNLIHKSVFERIGYFNERYKFWEDRPMYLKMTSNGIKIHFINTTTVQYRQHTNSVQKNTSKSLFSRTIISMIDAYQELIIPYLPRKERILYSYLMSLKKIFYHISNNRKLFIINAIYKSLAIPAEIKLNKIKSHYSP